MRLDARIEGSGVGAPGKPNRYGAATMTPHIETTLCVCGRTNCAIPYGLCHCGCGKKTPISQVSRPGRFRIKGDPIRFVNMHGSLTVPRLRFDDALPFKIDGAYCKLLSLTKNQFAIVDAEDYQELSAYRWTATYAKSTNTYYAYRHIMVNGRATCITMHRQIMGVGPGDQRIIDHANLNTLDNRRANIRFCTRAQNTFNQRLRTRNKYGCKGLELRGNTWYARLCIGGKVKCLGSFKTFEEAQAVRNSAAAEAHGEFIRLS